MEVDRRLLLLVGGVVTVTLAIWLIPFMLNLLLLFLMGIALLMTAGGQEEGEKNRLVGILKLTILVPLIAMLFTFNGYRKDLVVSEQSVAVTKVLKRVNSLLPRGKFDQAEERLLKVSTFNSATNYSQVKSLLSDFHRINDPQELQQDILQLSRMAFENLLLGRVDRDYLENRYLDREYIRRMVKLAPAMKKDFAKVIKKRERSFRLKKSARIWRHQNIVKGQKGAAQYQAIVREIGEKPISKKPFGEIALITDWLFANITDANRIRARKWHKIKLVQQGGKYFWWTILKYQTAHRGGRYSSYKRQFFIRNGEVIKSKTY